MNTATAAAHATETNSKKQPTRLTDISLGRRDTVKLRPTDIVTEVGHNPRDFELQENRDHLNEIKESIKAYGVLQPLWVRWEGATKQAILVDGETRLRAVLELIAEGTPIESVPAIQVPAGNEKERLFLALTANGSKPLSKWEAGQSYRKLAGYGVEIAEIAAKTGTTERYVREAIELSDAPEKVAELLSAHAITPAVALQAVREYGSDAGTVLEAKVEAAKQDAAATGTAVQPVTREKKVSAGTNQVSANGLKTLGLAIVAETNLEYSGEDTPYIAVSRDLISKLRLLVGT